MYRKIAPECQTQFRSLQSGDARQIWREPAKFAPSVFRTVRRLDQNAGTRTFEGEPRLLESGNCLTCLACHRQRGHQPVDDQPLQLVRKIRCNGCLGAEGAGEKPLLDGLDRKSVV